MEELYRGYDLWDTPHGWLPPYAKVFSSVVSGSDEFPLEMEPQPTRRGSAVADNDGLVLGMDAAAH